jgi:hypothetical protein
MATLTLIDSGARKIACQTLINVEDIFLLLLQIKLDLMKSF